MDILNRKSDFIFNDNMKLFNHDFRVFIFGAEVTAHIRGSLSVNRSDRQGAGTASFDLDGVNEIFLITAKNKGYIKDDITGDYYKNENASSSDVTEALSESAKTAIKKLTEEVSTLETKVDSLGKDLKTLQTKLDTAKSSKDKSSINKDISKVTLELETKQKELKVSKSRLRKLGNLTTKEGRYYVSGDFNNSNKNRELRKTNLSHKHYLGLNEKSKKEHTAKSEQIFLYGDTSLNVDSLYSDAAKKLIYLNKSILNANIEFGSPDSKNPTGFKPYPLLIDSCVIEKNDPIRVFIKDPCSSFESDRWIPMFTGFIQNITDHTNYENNEMYFTVTTYDIRGLMQKMRVMTNTRISHGKDNPMERMQREIGVNAGYFSDFFAGGYLGGEKSNKYLHKRFDSTVLDFITGRYEYYDNFYSEFCGVNASRQSILSTQSSYTINNDSYLNKINSDLSSGSTRYAPSKNGVGCFLPGLVVKYPSSKDDEYKKATLEMWCDTLVFGTKQTYWTFDEVTNVGINTMPYAEFDPYNCFLHMILPEDGTSASQLQHSQLEDLSPAFEFESRFEFLTRTCETLDYQVFCNGAGDLVIEFPMYDFEVDLFGTYSGQLKMNNHLITTAINEITDDVVTCVFAQGGVQSIVGNVKAPIEWVFGGVAKSDALAYKYGITIENFTVPYMRTDSSNKKLEKQAIIELIKRNVMATSMEVELAFRYALYPNKPMLHIPRNRIGMINSFSYNINVNESVSFGVGLNYIRKKTEDNKFINIYNGVNLPVNYNKGTNEIEISDASNTGIDAFVIKGGSK